MIFEAQPLVLMACVECFFFSFGYASRKRREKNTINTRRILTVSETYRPVKYIKITRYVTWCIERVSVSDTDTGLYTKYPSNVGISVYSTVDISLYFSWKNSIKSNSVTFRVASTNQQIYAANPAWPVCINFLVHILCKFICTNSDCAKHSTHMNLKNKGVFVDYFD